MKITKLIHLFFLTLLLFSFSQCKVPPPVDCEILLHKVDIKNVHEESEKEQLAKMQSVLDKVDADMALLNKEWNKLSWDDNKQIGEIDFTINSARPEDLEIFEDGKVPWVSIEQPRLESLEGKYDIVLPFRKAIVTISHSLVDSAEITIKSETHNGFTRSDLLKKISKAFLDQYQKRNIYAPVIKLDLVSVLVFEHLEDMPRLELVVSSKIY